jgi:hypothetical protein
MAQNGYFNRAKAHIKGPICGRGPKFPYWSFRHPKSPLLKNPFSTLSGRLFGPVFQTGAPNFTFLDLGPSWPDLAHLGQNGISGRSIGEKSQFVALSDHYGPFLTHFGRFPGISGFFPVFSGPILGHLGQNGPKWAK